MAQQAAQPVATSQLPTSFKISGPKRWLKLPTDHDLSMSMKVYGLKDAIKSLQKQDWCRTHRTRPRNHSNKAVTDLAKVESSFDVSEDSPEKNALCGQPIFTL